MINSDPSALFNAGTGLLIIVVGILVWAARRNKPANRAFLLWAVGLGLQTIPFNLFQGQPYYFHWTFWLAYGASWIIIGIGAYALAMSSLVGSAGLDGRRRWAFALPLLTAVPFAGVVAFATADVGGAFGVPESNYAQFRFTGAALAFGFCGLGALACLAALRARQDPVRQGSLAAISIALLILPANFAALYLSVPGAATIGWILVAYIVSIGAWWLAMSGPECSKMARNVAIIPLALAAAGYLLSLAGPGTLILVNAGYFGIGRLISAGLIAFAIVRHQILGFDIKVRRGVKGSTLAALFFAVFFVVSETVAQLFDDGGSGTYIGIGVAGLLLFFLAPLQRWADRLAGAATGDAKPASAQTDDEKLAAYRATAAAAWADGAIDSKERALLDTLRTTLGLSFEDAGRIESEVAP